MFEFAWPWMFFLIPFPLIFWFFEAKTSPSSAALNTTLFNTWQQLSQVSEANKTRPKWSTLLITLFWLLFVAAIARPQWIGEPIELPATGRDLMVSIDISGSMEQQDLQLNGQQATRLWVVKNILADFIEERQGDRLGLILFGENAYLNTPLTFDLDTVSHMLLETEIGLAGASRTAIGDGIGLAVKRLKERPAENRVLILLTDGQNNAGALDPIEAAKLAQVAGIKIYTIGVGADEMIVNRFGPRKVNPSEELDEETLTAVAEMTGGRYFRARDEKSLRDIYNELDKLEPVEDESEVFRPTEELYYWPILILLAMYAISIVVSQLISFVNRGKHV